MCHVRTLSYYPTFPICLRSDNGSQFTAWRVKRFPEDTGVATLFIEPAIPGRIATQSLSAAACVDYAHYRPHSSLSYMTPAGFDQLCRETGCIRPHTPVPDGVQDCGILSEILDQKKWQITGVSAIDKWDLKGNEGLLWCLAA